MKSFRRPLFDALLILLTLVGGYFAVQSSRKRASLSDRVAGIEKSIGVFPISDPNLVYVQALETENPLEFAWRIYLPANYKMTRVLQSFSSGSTSSGGLNTNPTEFIARVIFREKNGMLECFSNFGNSSSVTGFQGPVYADAFQNNFNRLEIKQLGKTGQEALDPDKELTLLRISFSSDLQHAMKHKFADSIVGEFGSEIIRIQFLKHAP